MAKKTQNIVKKKQKGKTSAVSSLTWKQKITILASAWLIVFLPSLIVYTILVTMPEDSLPSLEQLENPTSDEASQLIDINGTVLGTYFKSNRVKIDYPDLSPYLVDALVSTEDERFWEHSGVDGWALARAISGAGSKGGGSTITQQLAKMMFHTRPSSSIARLRQKFAEWKIAVRLESGYTKQEIIAMYFNEFDFLFNAVGVNSAAQVYFNTTPKDLKLEEAAMLVGMAKNPSIYNPKLHPEKALNRRNTVLGQMLKNNKITQTQKDSLCEIPLELDYVAQTHTAGLAPYFREKVKQEAKTILLTKAKRNRYGETYDLYRDGLKVYTTLDAKLQKHAEWAVTEHLSKELQAALDKNVAKNKNSPISNDFSTKQANATLKREMKNSGRYYNLKQEGFSEVDIEKNFNQKTTLTVFDWASKNHKKKVEMTPMDSIKYHMKVLRAGLVSIDPQTGHIKAYVGGPDYTFFKYDYASQAKRQVGSTIKPFVYGAAIESGVLDACYETELIKYCVSLENGTSWCPGNEKELDGIITPLYFGLANSSNPFTAFVVNKMEGSNSRTVDYFNKMGIKSASLKDVPSLALGSCNLSVLEMTSAHAIFSDLGMYHAPVSILRIEDANGSVIWEGTPKIAKVMTTETAFEILKIMKGVTGVTRPADGKRGGTAQRLRASGRAYQFAGIMAGKTGTTQNNTDGWFIGHTPDLVTGVWVGCDNPQVRFSSTSLGQGANTGLPIWGYYMQKVYADKSIKINKGDFTPPYAGQTTKVECAKKDVSPWDDPDKFW